MSELKMSDVFRLPMLYEVGDSYIYSEDCRYSIKFDSSDASCFKQMQVVANAINSHDKLTAENKRLREALSVIASWSDLSLKKCCDIGSNGQRDYYRGIAHKALSQDGE